MEYKFELYLTDKEKELFKFYGDDNAEEFKTMLKKLYRCNNNCNIKWFCK